MKIECIKNSGVDIAIISGNEKAITDTGGALDMVMSAKYETGAVKIAIDKRTMAEAFFVLSTGVLGETLQKLINYHVKVAIWGDYSKYSSKPLKDFIYEANRGKDFFFVETKEEAVQALTEA